MENPDGYRPANVSLTQALEADKGDESLDRWKSQVLGELAAASPADDPRHLILHCMKFVFTDGSHLDIILPIETPADLENLKNTHVSLKEDVPFYMSLVFTVHHGLVWCYVGHVHNLGSDIVAALKYLMATYRGPVRVDKMQYNVGSFAPRVEQYEFKVGQWWGTPAGHLPRSIAVSRREDPRRNSRARFVHHEGQDCRR